jgi:hypothetical protein
MSFTLSDLLQAVYTELGQLQASTVTGGTTDTLSDNRMQGNGNDDDWKDGALFIISADGSAPEGEYSVISAYDASQGEFSLQDALTAAPQEGDLYGLVSAYFPLRTMVELANAGLRALGDIPLVDTTTLETAVGQTEYAASLAWKRRPPVMIDYQGGNGGDETGRWVRVHDWEYVPADAGESGLIVFRRELPAARALRVWYVDAHPRLSVFDDDVAEVIAPELAVAAGVERALRWQNSRLGGGDTFLLQRWNDAKLELEKAKGAFPIWRPSRRGRLYLAGVGS